MVRLVVGQRYLGVDSLANWLDYIGLRAAQSRAAALPAYRHRHMAHLLKRSPKAP